MRRRAAVLGTEDCDSTHNHLRVSKRPPTERLYKDRLVKGTGLKAFRSTNCSNFGFVILSPLPSGGSIDYNTKIVAASKRTLFLSRNAATAAARTTCTSLPPHVRSRWERPSYSRTQGPAPKTRYV